MEGFTFTKNNITIRANDVRRTAAPSSVKTRPVPGRNMMRKSPKAPSRRDAVRMAALAFAASAIAPRLAFADEKTVAAELKKLYGGKPMAEGKIRLDVPEIAENGLVVPVNVEI